MNNENDFMRILTRGMSKNVVTAVFCSLLNVIINYSPAGYIP